MCHVYSGMICDNDYALEPDVSSRRLYMQDVH